MSTDVVDVGVVAVDRRRSPQCRSWPGQYWPFAFAAVVVAVVVLQRPGMYVYDSRFEHYWAPQRFLVRHLSVWDSVRSLGCPSQYYSPVQAVVLTGLNLVGAPPWLAERLLHAAYLVIGGLGMAALVATLRPRARIARLVGASAYVLTPFTTQFLIPSGLFLHHAVAPWLLVAA